MGLNENELMGQTSESDLFDFVKRAYFLIPKGKSSFKYYDTKAYYNEEGWYMYDADNIRQFLPEEWLIIGKID